MLFRSALVDVLEDTICTETGLLPEISCTGGTSDGRFIIDVCDQVVEFGPVNATIHKLNEHIELSAFDVLPRIYLDILRALLP